MAVRASMADLLSAARLLINDPAGDTEVFSDQQVQDALDHTRTDYRYLELAPAASIAPGGAVSWLDYYAMSGTESIGDWEDDVVLAGYPAFAVLTPVTSDPLVGHWTFDTSAYPQGQRPPVYLIGKTYDRYGAAVELLEAWAGTLTLRFGFRSDSQQFNVSEQSEHLLTLAARYKMKMRVGMLQMQRSDVPQELWQRRNVDLSRTTF